MIKRLFNTLQALLNPNILVVKWSQNPLTKNNLGDALNPYILEKFTGKRIINAGEVFNISYIKTYSFIGSVLDNSAIKNLTIIGSGFKRSHSKVKELPSQVLACRGPLTRDKIINLGKENVSQVYGDPAILLDKFFNPSCRKKYKIGFIPHYIDHDLELTKKYATREEVYYINIHLPVEDFITRLKECTIIISSSLHGVILAHTYGIPAIWIKISDNIAGDGFKFKDYYKSVDLPPKVYSLQKIQSLNVNELTALTSIPVNLEDMKIKLMDVLKKEFK